MTFTVKSVSKEEFDAWVKVQQQALPLTREAYAALAKPSEYVPPAYYSLPDPSLYTSLIMSYMMPGMQMSTTTP
jgi:cytochrome o ubiquinol oxidase subunit 2